MPQCHPSFFKNKFQENASDIHKIETHTNRLFYAKRCFSWKHESITRIGVNQKRILLPARFHWTFINFASFYCSNFLPINTKVIRIRIKNYFLWKLYVFYAISGITMWFAFLSTRRNSTIATVIYLLFIEVLIDNESWNNRPFFYIHPWKEHFSPLYILPQKPIIRKHSRVTVTAAVLDIQTILVRYKNYSNKRE